MSGGLAGLLAGVVLLAWAAPAHATYCRAKACDDKPAFDDVWQTEPDPPCDRDQFGCLLAGKPLYWPKTCISFSVQKDGSEIDGIDYETATLIIGSAFQTWLDAECPDGGTPSFAIADYGPVECNEIEYNQQHPNANVFMFRDTEWPHDSRYELALTTVSYDRETGEVFDADVEINSANLDFTIGDESVGYDLASVMTHEIGHFLGLSHDSSNPDATMWLLNTAGDIGQRSLHEDDIAGICEIYPPDRSVDAQRCDPRQGFSTQCVPGEEKVVLRDGGGCAVPNPASGHRAPFGIVAALSAAAVARRRKRVRA